MEVRLLYPHPALLLRNEDSWLVISDLHIGFEERFSSRGISIPPSTTGMLSELRQLLQEHQVDKLIVLGDVKYSVERVSRTEWREVPRFFEAVSALRNVMVIQGNHDGGLRPLLPREVDLRSEPYLILGDTALLHGHTKPEEPFSRASRIVMGHLHPTYSRKGSALSGSQVWVILRVERKALFPEAKSGELEIFILPSFNRDLAPLGFTSNRGRIISPIIRRLGEGILQGMIVTLEGDIIGDADSLPYIL